MTAFGKLATFGLLSWALIAAAPAGSDGPDAYGVRLPISAGPGSNVQRLAIPAQALAASQSAELADVRVFDAANRALPIARIAPVSAPGRRHELTPLPILGAADTLNVTGVSLRLDGEGRTRVARLEGTQPGGPAQPVVVGVLLDARTLTGNAHSLTLAADVPAGQPVTFAIEASPNVKDWRSLGEAVQYRGPAEGSGSALVLRLGDATLDRDYLRVSWRATSRLLSPVTVRKAALLMRADGAGGDAIAASLPPMIDLHIVEFAVPFATPLARIGVVPAGNDMIVPFRVLGRDNPEQPWALLGDGTAVRPSGADQPRDVALSAGTHRMIRIEADSRSPGFTSPPAITLGFAARDVAFLASGRPPYTLAAGRAGAMDAYLPLASLMTQAAADVLPVAAVRSTPGPLQLQPVRSAGGAGRQALLWGILLAATALLAAMAWILTRRGRAAS